MMHVTISYPLPDNQLLTQLFTALEEESVNVDMISQIVNLEGLQLSFQLKIVMHIKFLQFWKIYPHTSQHLIIKLMKHMSKYL